MGVIRDRDTRALAETWSPVVCEILEKIGQRCWPPKKERQGLLARPKKVARYGIEGPTPHGDGVAWALYHTSRPSSFDSHGTLTEGEREYWLVTLHPGAPPTFSVRGADAINAIPLDRSALQQALAAAQEAGPRVEVFLGNKGPLSHRSMG
jgi:hypothetical protein